MAQFLAQPSFLPASVDLNVERRPGRRNYQAKLISLPQTLVAWSFSNASSKRSKDKVVVGLVRLGACRAMTDEETDHATFRPQVSLWRDGNRYQKLDGGYNAWSVLEKSVLAEPLAIPSGAFVGGVPNMANRISETGWNDVIKLMSLPSGITFEDIFVDAESAVLLQLPKEALNCVGNELVKPKAYSKRFNITMTIPEVPAPIQAVPAMPRPGNDDLDDDDVEDPFEDAPDDSAPAAVPGHATNAALAARLAYDYTMRTPLFMVECVRLAWLLSSTRTLREVCGIVSRIICPERDVSRLPIPDFSTIRRWVIRLDLLHSRSRREFYSPLSDSMRIARYLSPDGSPQGGYDYYCMTEELLIHKRPLVIDINTDVHAHEYQRRSMPVTTMSRGKGSIAVKIAKVAHSIMVEKWRG